MSGAAVLGRAQERLLILRVIGDLFRNFLAGDTQGGPRHRDEPLSADFLFTVEANPEAAAIDAPQGQL